MWHEQVDWDVQHDGNCLDNGMHGTSPCTRLFFWIRKTPSDLHIASVFQAEALGISLSGNAAIPAVDSRRKALAHMSGMKIVEMVRQHVKPSDILTREAFENAIKVNCAIGG